MFGLTILETIVVIGLILCLATMFNSDKVGTWSFALSISLVFIWPLYILFGIGQMIFEARK